MEIEKQSQENHDNSEFDETERPIRKKREQKGNKQFYIGIIAVIIIGISLILAMQQENASGTIKAKVQGENLVIEASSLDLKAKFYHYDNNGVRIRFFAVEGYNGVVHVAFDACDVCYEYNLGYTQRDTVMECNNCGNKFLIDGIGTENLSGGCWPSYLPMTQNDSMIYIKISDVIEKEFMFH